ncbi:nucleolar transcription factor 1-like [Astatotilapia calliptera]|uniref:HMG box domain-containing protein n=1 Tax=Astatotilapia calliptera TaxID=8154 RepID=A0A3P8PII9_ASTCA|nr:nucleolar transcription factor 1-like [Astatotilapia calliptera]
MSLAGKNAEESGWCKKNLQKLLAAMKANILDDKKELSYTHGERTLDWEKVAFPPFSPEECKQKWKEVIQKMRKVRNLTELIVEAESVLSDPLNNAKLHPEYPKRPMPVNTWYYKEVFSKIKKKNPGMSCAGLMKIASKEFSLLPDKKKAFYLEKYRNAYKEFTNKRVELREKYGKSLQKSKRKKVVPESTSESEEDFEGLPVKPPISGYNLFCKELIGSMSVPTRAYIKEWSQRWRNLSEKERKAYNTRSKELKMRYESELHTYLMSLDEEKRNKVLRKTKISFPTKRKIFKRKTKEKIPGEPKMPSMSVNVAFCQDQMKILKEKIPNAKDRFAAANKKWHELSIKDKSRYQLKVNEKLRKYSIELQEWFKTLTPDEQNEYQKQNPRKLKYLEDTLPKYSDKDELFLKQPSDSEDEIIESSSDDEDDNILDFDEDDDEEEEEDDIMFDMY